MRCSPLASLGNQLAFWTSVPASEIGRGAELLHREDQAGRGARPAELLDRQADAEQLPAEAAVLLGEREGEDVLVGQQTTEIVGEFGVPVDVGGAWRDALVGEHADGVAEHLVLLREAERPGGAVRGRHRGHRTAHRTVADSVRRPS